MKKVGDTFASGRGTCRIDWISIGFEPDEPGAGLGVLSGRRLGEGVAGAPGVLGFRAGICGGFATGSLLLGKEEEEEGTFATVCRMVSWGVVMRCAGD